MAKVLACCQLFVKTRVLKHDPDSAPGAGRVNDHVYAVHAGFAGDRTDERRQHSEQRRLTTAVGPNETEEFARLDTERYIDECCFGPEVVSEALDLNRWG
jgi:hypothetical protein